MTVLFTSDFSGEITHRCHVKSNIDNEPVEFDMVDVEKD